MTADYGYDVFESGGDRVIRVRSRQSALNMLASEFALIFDYGMNRIQLLRHLTRPQAFALARELDTWLAA